MADYLLIAIFFQVKQYYALLLLFSQQVYGLFQLLQGVLVQQQFIAVCMLVGYMLQPLIPGIIGFIA